MESSPAHTRAIRSFVQHEDVARARAALDDAGITCTVREFRVPDPLTSAPVTRSLTLYVAPNDAATAARLMLKLPPSEAPAATTAKPEGPSRLRRSAGNRAPQKSALFIIAFAVICAGGMIFYAATGFFGPKKKAGPTPARDNVEYEEDLNYDGISDVFRGFTWDGIPTHHSEDRNFDALIDVRWIWQRGVTAYRDVDLNFDGKMDERTTYDRTGQPFYIDTRPGGAGPILQRRIFRQGVTWKILEDRDGDFHFDHLTEYDDLGDEVKNTALPPNSPEESPPVWPLPPWPKRDEEGRIMGATPPAAVVP